jgi:cytochrome c-type protein NapB
MRAFARVGLAALVLSAAAATAATVPEPGHPFTGPLTIPENAPAPQMAPEVADDKRRARTFPEQPPVIPHSIRGYQVDLRTNKCMTCHGREYTEQTQAPMISVTHYVDRDGQMLADVAPRRYVCTACHVPQTTVDPLVPNTFSGTAPQRAGGNGSAAPAAGGEGRR